MDRELTPISSLSPEISNFAICERVTFMKEITNGVSFDLTDTYGESIRCVAFGAAGEYCKRELKLNEVSDFRYIMCGRGKRQTIFSGKPVNCRN